MRIQILALSVALIFSAGLASADVSADLKSAVDGGKTLTAAVSDAITSSPADTEEIVTAAILMQPAAAGEIVQAAINAGAEPGLVVLAAISAAPTQAAIAVTAAVSLAPNQEDDIVQSAILAGADPTLVAAATAAGRAPPSPFAPSTMPNVGIGQGGVTPFGVGVVPGLGGSTAGNIGGGSASPS